MILIHRVQSVLRTAELNAETMLSSGNVCQEVDCSGTYGQLKPLRPQAQGLKLDMHIHGSH